MKYIIIYNYNYVSYKQTWSLESVLTAVFRGKLPQVKILHGEVNKGGQFAGSSCLREAFQVWTGGGVKEQLLWILYLKLMVITHSYNQIEMNAK